MANYRIGLLPGDGIGKDVMDAAQIVLDKRALDAEYLPGDIGWEFWCSEGNPLPRRTTALLKNTDCALFGAITSRPKEEAEAEWSPAIKGKGLVFPSRIVRLRQEFDLRTNLRPCKAYKGHPLNYRDDIDLVVFHENTEDLYAGVEFHPLPEEVMQSLVKHSAKMKRFAAVGLNDIAVSLRIITRQASQNIVRGARLRHGRRQQQSGYRHGCGCFSVMASVWAGVVFEKN